MWLLETLEDIMVNFEEVKPKILAINDQMERIMQLKQGESTTDEYFLRTVMKELKSTRNITDAIFMGKATKQNPS